MTHTASPKPLSVEEVRKRRRPLRNVNKEVAERVGRLDKLAVWITNRVGTMGFFLAVFVWTVLWLGWNLLAPQKLQFDPPMAFVFWLFISNLIQILLMPLVMVGQNILGRHAETRADHDLEVNLKSEQEIEVILHHLEFQNAILMTMLGKLGLSLDAALRKTGYVRFISRAAAEFVDHGIIPSARGPKGSSSIHDRFTAQLGTGHRRTAPRSRELPPRINRRTASRHWA